MVCTVTIGPLVARASTPSQAFTSDRSTTYQVDAAHTGNVANDSLMPPLIKKWIVSFAGPLSYPVVAGGRVYVTAANAGSAGSKLYALDQGTGATVWGPVDLGGNSNWSGIAYDRGRVFAVDNYGKITAFDAATGVQAWSEYVEQSYIWDGPPVGFGGFLYVRGDNGIHVLNEIDGGQYAIASAGNTNGSPAVSATGMYITDPCNANWRFDPLSGATVWQINSSCGGGGTTPVLFANRLYTRDADTGNWILDAANGAKLGTYAASTIPAFEGTTGFYLSGSTLTGTDLATGNPLWTFTGDGTLDTAPLVVAGRVFVGGSSGNLYVLDAATGTTLGGPYAVGAGMPAPQEYYAGNSTIPLTGIGAGGGWLDVSAGSSLVAYTSAIDVSEGDVMFPRQSLGVVTSSAIAITNYGANPSSASAVAITGPFQQTNDCGALAVGASCTITVDYTQATGPPSTGRLTFQDGSGATHQVPLMSDASDGFGPPPAIPQNRIITAFGSEGLGPALTRGQYPYALAAAPSHVYIGDLANPVVRDLNRSTGIETSFAGNNGYGYRGDGGLATSAMVNGAGAIARCADGTYFADTYNFVIRKVDNTGLITTFAGTGVPGYSGDGGPATQASLSRVFGLACRTGGGLYISDSDNGAIRIVDTTGTIHTWWYGFSFVTGLAELGSSDVLAASDAGADNLVWYLTDQSACVAGGSVTVDIMCAVGPATSTALLDPRGLLYSGGLLYLAELGGNRIRTINLATESLDTFAGTGQNGFAGDGGQATSAKLSQPSDLAIADNTLYIADGGSFHVRAVDMTSNVITTIAGNGTASWSGDGGPANNAQLALPYSVAVDQFGNAFVADNLNNLIRRIDAGGTMTTYAGNGVAGFYDNVNGASASFDDPRGVAVDTNGNVFVADTGNNRIRIIYHLNNVVGTVAGNGTKGYAGDGGPATSASLNMPRSVLVDSAGDIYIADTGNNRIREITPGGVISTIAGTGAAGYSGDGGPATAAALNAPRGLALDSLGNLYISDTGNNRVRKVDYSTKHITTVAGDGIAGAAGDGLAATRAQLNFPFGLAFDSSGHLFISDSANSRIRMVDPSGVIHTVVANCGTVIGFIGDGGLPSLARLNQPYGIATDVNDDLFVADSANNRVREASIGALGRGPTCPSPAGTPGTRQIGGSDANPPGVRLPNVNKRPSVGPPSITQTGAHRVPSLLKPTGTTAPRRSTSSASTRTTTNTAPQGRVRSAAETPLANMTELRSDVASSASGMIPLLALPIGGAVMLAVFYAARRRRRSKP